MKDTLELVNQYGIALVLVVILVLFFIGVFFFMLRWVVQMNKDMMKNGHLEKMALADLVNNGLKSITDSLHSNTVVCQQIAQNMKDGFDRQAEANKYNRSDLREIRDKLDAIDCKAA